MFAKVKEYINQRIQIPEEDLEKAFGYSSVRQYKKGDYLIKIGEYCRFIGFLNSGLIVGTILSEGKEIASNFTFEGCFFTYTEGISQHVPSHKNFIALEDCEMLMLSKEKLPLIFSLNAKFETLFTQILAEELRIVLLTEQASKIQSLETRYLNFLKDYPNAFNRIPLKYIAGYLGIEAPSLSRLRKRLASK
ncbi:Crp/Fnr family transcriptional regulator [Chitinophagaceae bacterium LB-8]|uniref:Crp/Fnr family transcriptional regulator n=1 Tax=Paraflavisolibacter caeni TaxID=2982496 RepID=A0A9X2XWQ8_9BACT|nr:Crp/Fnr family transcriptional regulator [Paraflavisolibacter caeni]MCU7550485.1 Crp/Fnr family transcriptional regulator [Paraflavisolibacter caeni]